MSNACSCQELRANPSLTRVRSVPALSYLALAAEMGSTASRRSQVNA
jgi:hypothetical protein